MGRSFDSRRHFRARRSLNTPFLQHKDAAPQPKRAPVLGTGARKRALGGRQKPRLQRQARARMRVIYIVALARPRVCLPAAPAVAAVPTPTTAITPTRPPAGAPAPTRAAPTGTPPAAPAVAATAPAAPPDLFDLRGREMLRRRSARKRHGGGRSPSRREHCAPCGCAKHTIQNHMI